MMFLVLRSLRGKVRITNKVLGKQMTKVVRFRFRIKIKIILTGHIDSLLRTTIKIRMISGIGL